MAAIGILWLVIGVLGVVDCLWHTATDWQYADRDRWFWAVFLFFFGPLFALPYLVMVRSRFPSRARGEGENPFHKR